MCVLFDVDVSLIGSNVCVSAQSSELTALSEKWQCVEREVSRRPEELCGISVLKKIVEVVQREHLAIRRSRPGL